MRITVRQGNKGFTLIEVLVASLMLTISMLGALDVIVLSMQQNLNNLSRDESVRIAEQKMNELRNSSFASLSSGSSVVKRSLKKFVKDFNVVWTVSTLTANSVAVEVAVGWSTRGRVYSHTITSIISRGT